MRLAWLLPLPLVKVCKVLEVETLGLDFRVIIGTKSEGPAVGRTFVLYGFILSGVSRGYGRVRL